MLDPGGARQAPESGLCPVAVAGKPSESTGIRRHEVHNVAAGRPGPVGFVLLPHDGCQGSRLGGATALLSPGSSYRCQWVMTQAPSLLGAPRHDWAAMSRDRSHHSVRSPRGARGCRRSGIGRHPIRASLCWHGERPGPGRAVPVEFGPEEIDLLLDSAWQEWDDDTTGGAVSVLRSADVKPLGGPKRRGGRTACLPVT